MELQEYRVNGKILAYVSQRNQGSKALIVVDDSFRLSAHKTPPHAHAQGLRTIFDKGRKLDEILAIGFFDLPKFTNQENFDMHIEIISEWIKSINANNISVYLLVDYFYGLNTLYSAANGLDFVNYLLENEGVLPIAKERIAHISIGGDLPNPHSLRVFRKSDIHDSRHEQGPLPTDFLEWLEIYEHPLEKLWRVSDRWFISDDEKVLMKHDFNYVSRFLFGELTESNLHKKNTYKNKIHSALGLILPDSWWNDETSAKNIHESLKSLCGDFACSQSNNLAKRNISVGGAYILALMAHQKIYGNIEVFCRDPEAWKHCPKATSQILPVQSKQFAKSSAKALYNLFLQLFAPREKDVLAVRINSSTQIKNVYFEADGQKLKIGLAWNATQIAPDRQLSLADAVSEVFSQNQLEISMNSVDTRNAIVHLLSCMAISEKGFMGPGVVYMEDNTVTIASIR